MSNDLPPPSRALIYVSKLMPEAWRAAEGFRLEAIEKDKHKIGMWPRWCYMPMAMWSWIAAHAPMTDERRDRNFLIPALGCLGPWRYTQGIYKFHPELQAALFDTELGGDIPVEVLLRLPEWCIYIDTAETCINGIDFQGFFAWLDVDMDDDTPSLCINMVVRGNNFLPVEPLPLRKTTLLEAIRAILDKKKTKPSTARIMDELGISEHEPNSDYMDDPKLHKQVADIYTSLISLLLYICADEPEIEGRTPGESPEYAAYKKTKKHGLKLFPPDSPRIWKVGYPVGEKLKEAKERKPRESTNATPHGKRAHVRRAHWHGYWTGPKKPKPDLPPEEQKQRRFGYKWLHPMIVAGGRDEDDG